MENNSVIRHEFVGPLIWSNRFNSYFMLKDEYDGPQTRALVGRGSADESETSSAAICEELLFLGVDKHTRQVLSPFNERLSGPLEVYFDFTWVCNLAAQKCGQDSYCYASDFLGKTTMRKDVVRSIMAELAECGIMRVHLAGGEPTSKKKDLANYLDSASEYGLYTSMATNGLLCDEEVLGIILKNNLKSLSFSLDGASEESHGRIRGPGLFAQTVQAIRRAVRMRNDCGSSMRVCIKPTYEPSTPDDELERLVVLAIELRADVIKFANPERCLHHDKGHYSNDVDAYYQKIEFISSLQARYGSDIKITNVNNPLAGCGEIGIKGLEGCIGGQELIAINPDGSVTPCLMHPYNLGNVVTEYRGIRDFWASSQKLPAFWAALKKPDGCNNCSIYGSCRSGSTTRRIVEVGVFDAKKTTGLFQTVADPLCPTKYLERHPEIALPPKGGDEIQLRHFKEIAVRHSL